MTREFSLNRDSPLHPEDISAPQSSPSTLSLSAYATGVLSPRTTTPRPQRRPQRRPAAVGSLLAVMAFVFLISYCRVWVMSSVGSSLVERGLASGGEEGEEGAKEQDHPQVCWFPEEGLDPQEGTFITGSHQPPATKVLDAGTLAKRKPRKRKGDHQHGKGYGVAAKTAKLSETVTGSSGAPLIGKPAFSSLSWADAKRSGHKVLQDQDSLDQSAIAQGSWEASTFSSDEEERSSERESSEFSDDLAVFTLEEALMAEKSLSLDSSSLILDEPVRQSPLLLPQELIPGLVTRLDSYISEALKAEDGGSLALWLLDPEAPVPSSPQGETPHGVDEEENSQGSALTHEAHQDEAALPLTSYAPAGVEGSSLHSLLFSQPDALAGVGESSLHSLLSSQPDAPAGVGESSSQSPLSSQPDAPAGVGESPSHSLLLSQPDAPAGVGESSLHSLLSSQPDALADVGGSSSRSLLSTQPDAPTGVAEPSLRSLLLIQPDLAEHPFYRLPIVPAAVQQDLLKTAALVYKYRVEKYDFHAIMRLALDLLAKQSLTPSEAENLHGCAQALRAHAKSRLMRPLTNARWFHFSHGLALRFLLADILWSASEVLGSSFTRGSWWTPLMEKVLAISGSWSPEEFKGQRDGKAKLEFVQAITRALDFYKAGRRPCPKEVVRIKRMIFCAEDRLLAFEQSLWDPWREADKVFWGTSKKK